MPNNERTWSTRKFLDRRIDPPMYVDEQIPSVTVKPGSRKGRIIAPRGTVTDSYFVTGSLREFIPGTYGLRITRVQVATGSRRMSWMMRHSREGTLMVVDFQSPGQENLLGEPMAPVTAVGPGTLIWGWLGDQAGNMGTQYYTSQNIEGIVSARWPDQV